MGTILYSTVQEGWGGVGGVKQRGGPTGGGEVETDALCVAGSDEEMRRRC